jgi:hypothetical protein
LYKPVAVRRLTAVSRQEGTQLFDRKQGLIERPQYSCNSGETVKREMAVNHRKTTAKANAPGSYEFYESPAQIGFAGVTTPLQLKPT